MIKKIIILFLIVFYKAGAQPSALKLADSLYALGNYVQAINQYAKQATPEASLQIARSYNALENYDKAILQYQSVLKQQEDWLLAKIELSNLYIKTRKLEKAEITLFELINKDSLNANHYYQQGKVQDAKQENAKALAFFKKAFQLDTTHLKSIYQLGKHFIKQKEDEQALKFIDKGLSFYENSVDLINLKALALYNLSEYQKAIPNFEKLIELGQEEDYIYRKLGYAYTTIWELDKAITCYEKLIQLNGNDYQAVYALGMIFWKQKKYKEALEYIKTSIAMQQRTFESEYNVLGRIAMDMKDLKNAINYYLLAHKENPSNPDLYYQVCFLADNYYKEPQTKLNYFEKFKSLYPEANEHLITYVNQRISEIKAEIHFAKE